MNLSQFYKLVLLIVLLGNIYAAQILPIKDENNIRLNIGDRERIYHEIPEEGLLFKGIGNSFDVGDSLRIGDRVKIGIYSSFKFCKISSTILIQGSGLFI